MDRSDCQQLDKNCRLAECRTRFLLPDGVLYFDGNSLGALPKTTATSIRDLVEAEWGRGLIRGWLDSEWFFLPRTAGDAIAPLIGAAEGEVVVSDSTSVNLFKLAASLLRHGSARRKVVTENGNFPTDTYILEGLIQLLDRDHELILAEPDGIGQAIDEETALVVLSHVDYRTGAIHDMEAITAESWRSDHMGRLPFCRRRAPGVRSLGCRLCGRLHLQIPEWRPRIPLLHLHFTRCDPFLRADSHGGGSATQINSGSKTATARRVRSTSFSSAPHRSCRFVRSSTA